MKNPLNSHCFNFIVNVVAGITLIIAFVLIGNGIIRYATFNPYLLLLVFGPLARFWILRSR